MPPLNEIWNYQSLWFWASVVWFIVNPCKLSAAHWIILFLFHSFNLSFLERLKCMYIYIYIYILCIWFTSFLNANRTYWVLLRTQKLWNLLSAFAPSSCYWLISIAYHFNRYIWITRYCMRRKPKVNLTETIFYLLLFYLYYYYFFFFLQFYAGDLNSVWMAYWPKLVYFYYYYYYYFFFCIGDITLYAFQHVARRISLLVTLKSVKSHR